MAAMAEGKLDGRQAYMGGKLKIKGNMMMAQQLQAILEAVHRECIRQGTGDSYGTPCGSIG